eukprot:1895919-Rhodomonas_salina.2
MHPRLVSLPSTKPSARQPLTEATLLGKEASTTADTCLQLLWHPRVSDHVCQRLLLSPRGSDHVTTSLGVSGCLTCCSGPVSTLFAWCWPCLDAAAVRLLTRQSLCRLGESLRGNLCGGIAVWENRCWLSGSSG